MTQVYLCYVITRHEARVIKVIDNYEESRRWAKERTKRIIQMEKLIARYYLAKSDKDRTKYFRKWSKHAKQYNLGLDEKRSDHHIHNWNINEELSLETLSG